MMTRKAERPMRRLVANGDPVTRTVVIRDQDTGEALWAGDPDDMRRAVRAIREQERPAPPSQQEPSNG